MPVHNEVHAYTEDAYMGWTRQQRPLVLQTPLRSARTNTTKARVYCLEGMVPATMNGLAYGSKRGAQASNGNQGRYGSGRRMRDFWQRRVDASQHVQTFLRAVSSQFNKYCLN